MPGDQFSKGHRFCDPGHGTYPTKVTEYAEQEDIPILMEIPFDRQIAETYSRGKLLVEELPDWKAKFIHLYEKITDLVRQE